MKTELKTPKYTVEITHNQPFPPDISKDFGTFIKNIRELDEKVQLASFELKKKPDGKYSYEFKAKDNREWKQIIKMDDPNDPLMNLDVSDFWRLSEFVPHRVLRDTVVSLIRVYEVEKIMCAWY